MTNLFHQSNFGCHVEPPFPYFTTEVPLPFSFPLARYTPSKWLSFAGSADQVIRVMLLFGQTEFRASAKYESSDQEASMSLRFARKNA
jgi:hypothetical protein